MKHERSHWIFYALAVLVLLCLAMPAVMSSYRGEPLRDVHEATGARYPATAKMVPADEEMAMQMRTVSQQMQRTELATYELIDALTKKPRGTRAKLHGYTFENGRPHWNANRDKGWE